MTGVSGVLSPTSGVIQTSEGRIRTFWNSDSDKSNFEFM